MFFERGSTRRRWLAHCSVALAFAATMAAMPSRAAVGSPTTILVVGDSLSAEYGLARGSGWVALLGRRLERERHGVAVANASISGDTTAGGLARLPALLRQHRPALVVLELGGNDALRGLPLDTTRSNLAAMTRLAKAAGAQGPDPGHAAAAELRPRPTVIASRRSSPTSPEAKARPSFPSC